ncbi:peroxiredoxin [Zeaxanthinibacter enoshimensis]|uniref:thioredoxin-dependent peroxiredoxin n=1 Tax=Zeaxanthinibacter enoshimensis TaxID=392009 RepID=A0A4R6TME9_9FLAO|nr:peroxiredoxin [Zeaxanthinibacter enoshimensis]TDQ30835.1 peroxiredoxin Q/BCP [Zeaxanthinibacter enoshimensis]
MGLKVGENIPQFSLEDQEGNIFDISAIKGKKPIVIFFYPKDNTPGCTKEACAFRDSYEDFTDLGAEVIGISSDSSSTHKRFGARYNLPFTLLSDPDGKVRKQFRVKGHLLNLLPGRETYVVNKEGKVVMVYNNMNASNHMEKALDALKGMK